MTREAFEQALRSRGFTYHASKSVWVGPFNIQVSGYLTDPLAEIRGPERDVGNQHARASKLSEIDMRLKSARGLPRDPLVEPVNQFTPYFSPYAHVPDPGTSPQVPLYPGHQQNLPPGARRAEDGTTPPPVN